MTRSLFSRLYTWAAETLDQKIGWHRLPLLISLGILAGLRIILRERNLYDTTILTPIESDQLGASTGSGATGTPERYLTARSADGTYNDLAYPKMGSANSRFGRNVPLSHAYPDDDAAILTPSPRIVSRELLARDTFKPATSINMLVAAWVQFMIHDWFSHGKNQKNNPWEIPLTDDDPWPYRPMEILRTQSDPTRTGTENLPPTYLNTVTHWWDGSQIYGSDAATQAKIRSGENGKLIIGSDGLLPIDENGIDITAVNGNWWIGLSIMHTLFTLEHNAICNRLHGAYPSWSDDDLFDRARLVNAALIAKIHTINWTTAILGNPTLQVAMNGNWWGLATEQIYKMFGRISKSEIISGIPGSPKQFFDVPYTLTEEFVSVYRMHPLLPDEFTFRSVENNQVLLERPLAGVADANAHDVLKQVSLLNALYTFGTSNPGAIALHNYPNFLRERRELDNILFDLATTEILRDRERGVPRYVEFRKLVNRTPVTSFEQITDNPKVVQELRRIYDNDINKVDLMVGMYAEPLPQGFAFSDTAFRIFILMASRRLESDRFFTTDYNPNVYSEVGFKWVQNNDMKSVLLRHFPQLGPALQRVKNPFAPWPSKQE